MKAILCLILISVLCNGCALTGKTVSGHEQNVITQGHQGVEDVGMEGIVGNNNETFMNIITFIALPVLLPFIFVAAIFSGAS